jgi:hypothetical protein
VIARQLQRAEISFLTILGAFSIHLLSPPFDLHHSHATSDRQPGAGLCRCSCRNPAITAGELSIFCRLNLGGQKAANMHEAGLTTADSCSKQTLALRSL